MEAKTAKHLRRGRLEMIAEWLNVGVGSVNVLVTLYMPAR